MIPARCSHFSVKEGVRCRSVSPNITSTVLEGNNDCLACFGAGQGGLTIKKTNSALVVGIYGEGVQPADCNVTVERLGDYLIEQGI